MCVISLIISFYSVSLTFRVLYLRKDAYLGFFFSRFSFWWAIKFSLLNFHVIYMAMLSGAKVNLAADIDCRVLGRFNYYFGEGLISNYHFRWFRHKCYFTSLACFNTFKIFRRHFTCGGPATLPSYLGPGAIWRQTFTFI